MYFLFYIPVCDSSCETCTGSAASECTSCFDGYYDNSGTCTSKLRCQILFQFLHNVHFSTKVEMSDDAEKNIAEEGISTSVLEEGGLEIF